MATKARRVPLDRNVSYRFWMIVKRLELALAAIHSRKLGISVANWRIMRVIGFFGPLSASEVGARTHLDPDKVTRAVDTLVERNYVVRRTDDADRRRVVLTLSAKGRRVYEKIESLASEMEVEFLKVLTADERKVLQNALGKLDQQSRQIVDRREGYPRRQVAAEAVRGAAARPVKRSGRGRTRQAAAAK